MNFKSIRSKWLASVAAGILLASIPSHLDASRSSRAVSVGDELALSSEEFTRQLKTHHHAYDSIQQFVATANKSLDEAQHWSTYPRSIQRKQGLAAQFPDDVEDDAIKAALDATITPYIKFIVGKKSDAFTGALASLSDTDNHSLNNIAQNPFKFLDVTIGKTAYALFKENETAKTPSTYKLAYKPFSDNSKGDVLADFLTAKINEQVRAATAVAASDEDSEPENASTVTPRRSSRLSLSRGVATTPVQSATKSRAKGTPRLSALQRVRAQELGSSPFVSSPSKASSSQPVRDSSDEEILGGSTNVSHSTLHDTSAVKSPSTPRGLGAQSGGSSQIKNALHSEENELLADLDGLQPGQVSSSEHQSDADSDHEGAAIPGVSPIKPAQSTEVLGASSAHESSKSDEESDESSKEESKNASSVHQRSSSDSSSGEYDDEGSEDSSSGSDEESDESSDESGNVSQSPSKLGLSASSALDGSRSDEDSSSSDDQRVAPTQKVTQPQSVSPSPIDDEDEVSEEAGLNAAIDTLITQKYPDLGSILSLDAVTKEVLVTMVQSHGLTGGRAVERYSELKARQQRFMNDHEAYDVDPDAFFDVAMRATQHYQTTGSTDSIMLDDYDFQLDASGQLKVHNGEEYILVSDFYQNLENERLEKAKLKIQAVKKQIKKLKESEIDACAIKADKAVNKLKPETRLFVRDAAALADGTLDDQIRAHLVDEVVGE